MFLNPSPALKRAVVLVKDGHSGVSVGFFYPIVHISQFGVFLVANMHLPSLCVICHCWVVSAAASLSLDSVGGKPVKTGFHLSLPLS